MALRNFPFIGVFTLLSMSLSACATLSGNSNAETKPAEKTYTDRLPPQNLSPGKCGLFTWTADDDQIFIGFETDDRVELVLEGKRYEGRRVYKDGMSLPNRLYVIKTEEGVEKEIPLSLIEDKEIAEGTRYYGRLKSQTENGWERITPIVALYSCVSTS